mmetsp:Transcript_117275/g.207369  ORF Transcript_117275/g.207369 Transcript_117275/m.207369 type:complete len:469 (-) Transcript_117275:30-1436(-)
MLGVIEWVEKVVAIVVACGAVHTMISTVLALDTPTERDELWALLQKHASVENVKSVTIVVLTAIGGLWFCFKKKPAEFRARRNSREKAVYRAGHRAHYNHLTVSLNMLERGKDGEEFYIRTVQSVKLTNVFGDEDYLARFKELLHQTTESDPFLPFNRCGTKECQNWVNNVIALDQEVKKDLLNLMSQESSSCFFEGVCEEEEYCFAVTMEKHEQGSKIAEKPRVYLQKKTSLEHLFKAYVQTGAKPKFPETPEKMEKRWKFAKMWAERVFGNNPDAGLEDSNIRLAVPAMHRTFNQLCDVRSKQNEIYNELGDVRNKQTKMGEELDDVRKKQTEIQSQLDGMRNEQMGAQNILQSVQSMLQKINVQLGDVDALNTNFNAMKTELLESRADVQSSQTELRKMHAEVLASRSELQGGAEAQDAVQKTPKKPQPNSTASTATPSSAASTDSLPSRSLSDLMSPQNSQKAL